MPSPESLPVDAALQDVIDALRAHGAVVLSAETGAGKTSRVPPALIDSGSAGSAGFERVVMLEPRRLAARAAARRIAFERGTKLGEEVGYHVRFDRRAGPRTRLLVVTEGILVRMLQEDPFLEGVDAVVFDEFHERSLDADLSLALVEKVRREARRELRVVVMSATLEQEEIEGLARFLGGAPVVRCPGRQFAVDVEWAPTRRDDPLEEAVAGAVGSLLPRTSGDVLVFLPGIGEIRRAGEVITTRAASGSSRDLEVLELHGDLPPERQDAALEPGSRRRVILATNVAETSVTLPRVTAVVDSGLVRRMQFDPASGLDRLELGRVSKASSEQRRGRAGRVAPGVCVRLWSALDHRGLADREEPEIRRVDLAGLALQLLAFGERDLGSFRFVEAPEPARLEQALDLLVRLGAIARDGTLTERGRAMAAMPVHPRLARMLIEGGERGVLERTALAAALLSERDPFLRPPQRRGASHESESDVVDRVVALEDFAERGATRSESGELHRARADWVLRGAEQLARIAGVAPVAPAPVAPVRANAKPDDRDEALRRAVMAGFADRLVRRREAGSARGVMVGGKGVRLAQESAVRGAELFVAVDLEGGSSSGPGRSAGSEALVRAASAVELSWLDPSQVVTEDVVRFDRERETVVARRVTRFADLVLDERTSGAPDAEEAARVLAEAAAEDVSRALGLAREEVASFLARVRFLRESMPELGMPRLDVVGDGDGDHDGDGESWRAWLPDLCYGKRSFAELQQLPLVDLLRARLGAKLARALDVHAPERLTVPSGSAIRLEYPADGPPVLAVRMQELFGLAQTPRVGDGRVPVLLHLLAPNHRPQQVTQDLASFWNSVYPKIRGELRARYPRHSWPDDPWNAPPVRGPRKRR